MMREIVKTTACNECEQAGQSCTEINEKAQFQAQFDELSEVILALENKRHDLLDELDEVIEAKEKNLAELQGLMDAQKISSGMKYEAINETVRRSIGTISDVELARLKLIHPDLVRIEKPRIVIELKDDERAIAIHKAVSLMGEEGELSLHKLKAPTLGAYEKIITKNPRIIIEHPEVIDLIHLEEKKEMRIQEKGLGKQ